MLEIVSLFLDMITAQCHVSILSTSYLWSNIHYIKNQLYLFETQLLSWVTKMQMVGLEKLKGLPYLL